MPIIKTVSAIAAVVSTVAALGCTADATPPDGNDEPIGVVRDPLTGVVFATWGGVGTTGPSFANGMPTKLDLGVGDGWTCWLAGVAGPIIGTELQVNKAGPSDGQIPAHEWWLLVSPAPGIAANGMAACAPSSFLVNSGNIPVCTDTCFDDTETPVTLRVSANSSTWCGLGGFFGIPDQVAGKQTVPATFSRAIVTNSSNAFNSQIVIGDPNWTIQVSGAFAQGQCASALAPGFFSYGIQAPPVGTASFNLLENDGHTPIPQGSVCFLTELHGSFSASSFTDGVGLTRSSSGLWTLKATNGKGGTVLCVL